MDFLKVLDQTVRELKREVNLKVLNIPEMEQKVMDATDDEPWGPHGTALAEIAVGTKKFTDCQLIMDVLWTRLSETDKNWRCVYKALAVIEYLVSHGSVRAVDDIIEHTYQISTLSRFEYVEPSGKDMGINVRKKAENIVALLNNKDKIQEVRNKAAANRDKYIGLSSSDVRSKSGVNSLSSSSFKSNERYGGFGSTSDDEYKFGRSSSARSRREVDSGNSSKKGTSQDDRKRPVTSASKTTMKVNEPDKNASNSRSSVAPSKIYEDDDDDFDPRGTSSAKPSAGSTNQVEDLFDPWNTSNAKPSTGSTNEVDLFGKNSVDDLLSVAPAPVSVNKPNAKSNPSEIDLFANDGFGSAISQPGFESSGSQNNVDLFASQSAPCAVSSTNNVDLFAFQSTPSKVSPTIDLFANPDNNTSSNTKQMNNNIVDPFASVPLNNFDGPDPFGGAFTSPSQTSQTPTNLNGLSVDSKSSANKDTFQVKSDVWADSLSRGLFDLNITASKSANLADVGIVGSADGSDSFFMGGPTAAGSAIGNPGNSSTSTGMDDLFSSLSNEQYQFGSFKK